jgi:hypothetical protein
MGYQTTIVFLNDSVKSLEKDPDLGKNLAKAILEVATYGKSVDCPVAGHVNAIQVVETHHANIDVLVKVGGNRGYVVDPHLRKTEG